MKISELGMKGKATLLVATFVLGFLVFGALSFSTVREVRVGGARYTEIVDGMDLMADAMPPKLFIVESYLSTYLMQDASRDRTTKEMIEDVKGFKKEFEASCKRWNETYQDGAIASLLRGDVTSTAEDIFESIVKNLAPALESGDSQAIADANKALAEQFTDHKTAIDELVRLVREQNDADKAAAVSVASSRTWMLMLIGFGVMGGVLAISFWLRQSIAAQELLDLDNAGKMDAINRSQAIIEFDLQGNIVSANDNFLATLGYSLDEIKGKHHSMFVEESYRNSSEYRNFWPSLARGTVSSGEFQRYGKGGKMVWIQANYSPILGHGGKPIKVVKYAVDITAQKVAAVELRHKVDSILEVVNAAAAGDLTQSISVSGDDAIGQMGVGLERFFRDLRNSVASIAHR